MRTVRSRIVVSLLLLATTASAFAPPSLSSKKSANKFSEPSNVLFSLKPRAQDQFQVEAKPADLPPHILEQFELAFAASNGEVVRGSATPPTSTAIATANNSEKNSFFWRGVVVLLCALWASNFAAIKLVVSEPGVDSSLYAVARFGLATASLLPFCLKQLTSTNTAVAEAAVDDSAQEGDDVVVKTGMDWETLQGAMACGSWVAFGYIGQLLGLLTTTASKSCVICSLHCVFVAAMAEFWRSRDEELPFQVQVLAPAALAVVGVSIVEGLWSGGGTTANMGDLLSFAQPIGFGMGYLQLEKLMAKRPDLALPVSAIKLAMVTAASLFYFEVGPLLNAGGGDGVTDFALRLPDFGPILSSPLALAGVVYTGLVTTALALWIESVAFARVSATTASLILTTEPLFAAGFGALALGETFGGSDYVGAACIVGACVLATLLDNHHSHPGVAGDEAETPFLPDAQDDPDRQWRFFGYNTEA